MRLSRVGRSSRAGEEGCLHLGLCALEAIEAAAMSMNCTVVSLLRLAADAVLLSLAYWLAFVVRFEGSVPPEMGTALWGTLPYVLLVKVSFLIAQRVPWLTWRFVSLIEARRLIRALTAATGFLAVFVLTCRGPLQSLYLSVPGRLPLGVLPTDLLLSLAAMLGVRILIRSWME